MPGMIYKRCGCKEAALDSDGHPVLDAAGRPKRRELGSSCPRLRGADGSWSRRHGSWWFLYQLPASRGTGRRHLRRGGHAPREDAEAALATVEQLIAVTREPDADPDAFEDLLQQLRTCLRERRALPDPDALRRRLQLGQPVDADLTVGQWLAEWLTTKSSLRPTTLRSYESHIRLYLTPHLGHLRLDRLRAAHIHAMFAAIEKDNAEAVANNAQREQIERWRRAAYQVRDLAEVRRLNEQLHTLPPYRRQVGPSSQHSIRATLRSALTDAAAQQLITVNTARLVKLTPRHRPRARVWTRERVERWRKSGEIPSPVMVWTPEQTSAFLHRARSHPLQPMWRLIAHIGLRRGEAVGLRWSDVDLRAGTLTVTEQIVQLGWATAAGRPKSEAGDRVIALGGATSALLRGVRRAQRRQRLAFGEGWPDTGHVFTDTEGNPWHPAQVTSQFAQLIREAELPPIRLHDLRHGTATHALSAGVDTRVVQDLLGHSSSTLTRDTYMSVVDDVQRAAAEAISGLIDGAGQADGEAIDAEEAAPDDPDDGEAEATS